MLKLVMIHSSGLLLVLYLWSSQVKKMVVAILEESDLELPDDIVEAIVENVLSYLLWSSLWKALCARTDCIST